MKESSFQLAIEGLRVREHDAAGMEYLRNLVPRDGYWQCPKDFTPFEEAGAVFPFPQLFRGETTTFVCLEDRIGIMNETLQAVSWMPHNIAAGGGPWSFCDWGPGYVFTNAENTIYALAREVDGFLYPPVITRTTSKFSCCCDHLGRLIYAVGNEVFWSSKNADDILAIVGGVARADLFNAGDIKERREFGGVTMPWRGNVLACKPLGVGVAIYGEDGVTFIRPQEASRSYDLPFVPGLPAGVGIAGPLAVAGNESSHVFVGSDGRLWSLSANGEAQQLLSNEFLGVLSSPVLTIDPEDNDLWMADAAMSYCMTKQGLGGPMLLAPYSIIRLKDGTVMRTGRNYNAGDAVIVEARSGIKDFGEGGRMHVSVMQIGSSGLRLIRAGMQHRFSTLEDWRSARTWPCNKTGWARVRTTGVQVKAIASGVVADVRVGATIHRAEVRYLLTDKRGRRGTKIFGGVGRVMGEE